MTTLIIDGLTLNKKEQGYLKRLLTHDWHYPVASNNRLYNKGKENEIQLKQIADKEGGNFPLLFERVEQHKRGVRLSS